MTRINKILISIMLALGLAAPALIALPTYAATALNKSLQCGVDVTANPNCSVDSSVNTEGTVTNIISTGLNLFSLAVGIVAVVMMIVGGLKYITSGGDSGNVTGAKNSILYAIVGLVIVALAQVIVKFILKKTTDATI